MTTTVVYIGRDIEIASVVPGLRRCSRFRRAFSSWVDHDHEGLSRGSKEEVAANAWSFRSETESIGHFDTSAEARTNARRALLSVETGWPGRFGDKLSDFT